MIDEFSLSERPPWLIAQADTTVAIEVTDADGQPMAVRTQDANEILDAVTGKSRAIGLSQIVAAGLSPTPLRPGDVVRNAKARARDIRAELRHHEKLKRELAQLERLIAAASETKPSRAATGRH